ncbi:MAG: alpha/beta fold hydrolase [Gemmatimonadaceae bacterium]
MFRASNFVRCAARQTVALLVCSHAVLAQTPQGLDRSRNNIRYPNGYVAASDGDAGRIERIGSGSTPLVFIAGWGFSADVFRDFARSVGAHYTSYLVTLPGFGGTPGWPMPADSISHATTPWMSRSAAAIARTMNERGVRNAVVIGHFIVGSHVALELAQRHPERVGGLMLVGGELSRYWPSRADTTGRTPSTPAQRAASVDRFLVPQFFRFVTDSTWHANNYIAHTFSVDSVRAAPLWREQASVPLPIMIRYLSDFYATEFAPKLDSIRVPILVLQPGFNEKILADSRTPYLKTFFQDSWAPARGRGNVAIRVVPNAAVNIWLDQPDLFRAELTRFAAGAGR